MVTKNYHLVEWHYWDKKKNEPGALVTRELYDLQNDPQENFNIAVYPESQGLIEDLSTQRQQGWIGIRNKLPSK